MSYKVIISPEADKDIKSLRKAGDKMVLSKLNQVLSELQEHPEIGSGQPERLKHNNKDTGREELIANTVFISDF